MRSVLAVPVWRVQCLLAHREVHDFGTETHPLRFIVDDDRLGGGSLLLFLYNGGNG